MEFGKWLLLQLAVVAVAVAQQPDAFQLAQQIGVRSTQFQQQHQLQQQQQQRVAPSFQQGIRTLQPQQTTFGKAAQQAGVSQHFNQGAETFQQINTRATPQQVQQAQQVQQQQQAQQVPQVQTRTFGAARPLADPVQQNQFQQQQRVGALTPTAFPSPVPSPVEFANAVPAPVQQHDAQVFTRRPPPPPAPAAVPADSHRPRPQDSFQQNVARLPAVMQDTTGFQPQPHELQNFLPQQDSQRFQQDTQSFQQDPQSFQQNGQAFQQDVQSFQQSSQPAQPATRTFQRAPQASRTRGQVRHPSPDTTASLRSNPIRVAPAVAPAIAPAAPSLLSNGADQSSLQEDDQLFREQAQNAHYTFASAVDDKLTDNSQVRQETRDGLNLSGLYSYSDGFFRRTVHYEADENGYRVTKEEVEPIGDGPNPNPAGAADVAAQISGTDVRYRITADDIKERKQPEAIQQPL